jgi:hypothetical protein
MYFYHEHKDDAYYTAGEDVLSQGRRDAGQPYEPIGIPAIINWVVSVSVALLVITAAIQFLI